MRVIKVLLIVGALALALNCEKEKETASCAEDIICSYLLVNSNVKGNINITASTGALSNSTTYNVAVYSAADCAGTTTSTTEFSSTGRQSTYLSGFASNAQYSVRAYTNNNSLSICSSSFSFNIDKQTYNCRIGSSAITCN